MSSYEIVLQQVPVSLNMWQSVHWAARDRWKSEWTLELFALANGIPKNNSHVDISAVIWFQTSRRRDVDNFASVLWKMTQDALVEIGIIADDTPDYITTGTVDLRVDKHANEHTILTIQVEA
jgi:Holliday junction resolvase RusA-like endonuclease